MYNIHTTEPTCGIGCTRKCKNDHNENRKHLIARWTKSFT